MAKAEFSQPRRQKVAILIVIVLIHVAVIAGLIRAFSPDLPGQIARQVVAAFDVTVDTRDYEEPDPPQPEPQPEPARAAPQEQGAQGEAGKKATPREVTAPVPKIVLATKAAPRVAGSGNENSSGAREAGEGTGAGRQGQGTGAGGEGSGQGGGGDGGVATKAVKVAGDINSARDYPRESRELRLGDHVVLALTVGTDGRVKSCRIHRASRDPVADRITCQLATQRFRFEPARTASGRPVESVFGWRQEWFRPS